MQKQSIVGLCGATALTKRQYRSNWNTLTSSQHEGFECFGEGMTSLMSEIDVAQNLSENPGPELPRACAPR